MPKDAAALAGLPLLEWKNLESYVLQVVTADHM
jgi:hypothetical protein